MKTRQLWARSIFTVTGRIAAFIGIFVVLGVSLEAPIGWLNNHLSVCGTPRAAYPLASYTIGEARSAVCALIAYMFVNRALEKQTLSQAGFALVHVGRDLAAGFLLGLLTVVIIFTVLWATGLYRILGRSPHFYLLLVVGLSLCTGIFEETVFRGLLFGLIERWAGTGWAISISSALFGLAHLLSHDGDPLGHKLMRVLAIIVGSSLFLNGVYLWTRRLWMPIALHTGWDFLAFTLSNGLDLPNVSAYVTHNSSAYIGYLPVALVPAAGGILLIRAAIRQGEWKTMKRPSATRTELT